MKRLPALWCVALLQASAHATEVQVGSTRLVIPAPTGCSLVASDLPYAKLMESVVAAQNQQLALFLPDADAAVVAKGGVPDAKRTYSAQALKADLYHFVSIREFETTKRAMKDQHEALAKQVERQMPGLLDQASKGLSKDREIDVALSGTEVLPFPPHHESDRSLALSMIVKYAMTVEHGAPLRIEASVTTTLVHVRGKVIFLYVTAPVSDLDSCRRASSDWAAAVIAANPSTGDVAAQERGFDWTLWLRWGLAACAIAVGAIAVVRRLVKGRKG